MDFEELAPGIILYRTDKDTVATILDKIKRAYDGKWTKSQVVNTDDYSAMEDSGRKCQEFGVGTWVIGSGLPEESAYFSLSNWIQPKIDHFVNNYSIERVVPGPFITLKYEQSDKFDNHIDDGGRYPRTVSVSAYLNDDYDGGEIEFPLFGISHKPQAGDIVVFSSSFPYVHRVLPTYNGTRYAVVNWYRYENYPEEIY